jgi:hypothetical protein
LAVASPLPNCNGVIVQASFIVEYLKQL